MSAPAAEPQAIASRATRPPPAWALPFAWTGALLFALSLTYFAYAYAVRFGRAAEGDSVVRPILINAVLFTLFAVHHSVFARSGAKAWLRRRVHAAIERSVYVWAASLLFIAVCWGWQLVPGVAYTVPPPWSLTGYAVQGAGLLLTVKGSKVLDVLDLSGVRSVLEPPPSAARHVPLITTGVYGLVRHPIYLGWALLVFGAPHMTATRLVFAVISTLYLVVAIPWEERGLVREFGAPYEAYRRQVRWRMLPRLY